MSVSRLKSAVLALVPFALAGLFWRAYPQVLIDADTPRYLANDPMRTATYPLFLDATYGPALLPLQLLLFAISLAWLGLYSARFLSWAVSAALVLAIGANPYLWELQATIMSEALTTPILTVIVGCVVGFIYGGRSCALIAAAVLCGVATSIRPPCAALLAVPVLAAVLAPKVERRMRLLAIVLLAWTAPVVAERAYSYAVHGNEVGSPIGRHAFMKAAIIEAPRTSTRSSDPLDRLVVNALNDDLEPVRRTIAAAPDWHVRYILLTNYEACLAWACGDKLFAGTNRPRKDIDHALFNAGWTRLKGNPAGYLNLTGTEYLRMWLLHPRKHPDLAPEYNAFLAVHSPLPFQLQLGVEGRPTAPDEVSGLFRINRLAFASVGMLAALMTVVAAFTRGRLLSRAALPLLLAGQAVLVLSAFAAVGLPRYAMGMWPVLIAGIWFATVGIVQRREIAHEYSS